MIKPQLSNHPSINTVNVCIYSIEINQDSHRLEYNAISALSMVVSIIWSPWMERGTGDGGGYGKGPGAVRDDN